MRVTFFVTEKSFLYRLAISNIPEITAHKTIAPSNISAKESIPTVVLINTQFDFEDLNRIAPITEKINVHANAFFVLVSLLFFNIIFSPFILLIIIYLKIDVTVN